MDYVPLDHVVAEYYNYNDPRLCKLRDDKLAARWKAHDMLRKETERVFELHKENNIKSREELRERAEFLEQVKNSDKKLAEIRALKQQADDEVRSFELRLKELLLVMREELEVIDTSELFVESDAAN